MKIKNPKDMKKTVKILFFIIIVIIVHEAGKVFPLPKLLYLNTTASEPLGVYVIEKSEIKKGDMVVFKVPPNAEDIIYGRNLLKKPGLMLKEVYALPGENYTITDKYIYVNGCRVGKVSEKDSKELPLPKLRGNFTVKKGYFLALATYRETSLDSRYFGEVSQELIVAKVTPIALLPKFLE